MKKKTKRWNKLIRRNWKENYPKYLQSAEWRKKRKRVLAAAKGRCFCGMRATEVHHKHYKSVGQEKLRDLRAVCSRCHKMLHRKKKRRSRRTT